MHWLLRPGDTMLRYQAYATLASAAVATLQVVVWAAKPCCIQLLTAYLAADAMPR